MNVIPDELKDKASPYEDSQIRELTEKDRATVSVCCTPDPDDYDINGINKKNMRGMKI